MEIDCVASRIAAVAFLAPDYDEAIAWFRDRLGFAVIEDCLLYTSDAADE